MTEEECQNSVDPDSRIPRVSCPRCGVEMLDFDGLGFVQCPECHHCSHPGWDVVNEHRRVCGICGKVLGRERPARGFIHGGGGSDMDERLDELQAQVRELEAGRAAFCGKLVSWLTRPGSDHFRREVARLVAAGLGTPDTAAAWDARLKIVAAGKGDE